MREQVYYLESDDCTERVTQQDLCPLVEGSEACTDPTGREQGD